MAELTLVCIVAGEVFRPARLRLIETPIRANGFIDRYIKPYRHKVS